MMHISYDVYQMKDTLSFAESWEESLCLMFTH